MLPVVLTFSAILLLAVLYLFRGTLLRYSPFPSSAILITSPTRSVLPDDGFSSSAQGAVDDLSMEIDDLHWLLANKKADLQNLKAEHILKGEMAMKVDAIEDTIDTVETRLRKLQSNLENVRQTAVTLDQLSVALQQSQEGLLQSQQALQATQAENSELRQQVEELQDYAADQKEQRLLLRQKIQLLEDLQHTP